jgi:hypothetical protein
MIEVGDDDDDDDGGCGGGDGCYIDEYNIKRIHCRYRQVLYKALRHSKYIYIYIYIYIYVCVCVYTHTHTQTSYTCLYMHKTIYSTFIIFMH